MRDGKVVIARVWPRYDGKPYVRAGEIFGLNPDCFETICIYLMKSCDKENILEKKGYKTFYLSRKRFFRMFNLWSVWKVARILKEQKVDIVQCHKHQSTVYGTLAAIIAKVPIVFAHVEGLNRTRNIRRKLVNRFILKRVKKILAVADRVRDDVLINNPTVPAEKVVTIGNSVDFQRFASVRISKGEVRKRENLPMDAFIFGTVGRLAPTKGYQYLVCAFTTVKKQVPNAFLVFIGEGRLRSQLEKEIENADISDSVRFFGRREDIPELLRALDCFVLPSIAEGMPTVILEAMASRVPCVATNVGGIPEIITDSQTGFLIPSKDENALADVMIRVSRLSHNESEAIMDRSQNMVRNFYDHSIMTGKLENLYRTQLKLYVSSKT
jgi:glycosyltransferase involved in cell wall biosynthesis